MKIPSKDEAQNFMTRILNWYEENGREFLWRREGMSLYEILVVEIMLQQTRASKVEDILPAFLKKFPDWGTLGSADVPEIEKVIKPLGLHKRRSRGLKKLAKAVQGSDIQPDCLSSLLELPNVGKYIGRSVLVNYFEEPEPMLDVNMARVLERYFGSREKADIRDDEKLHKVSKRLIRESAPKKSNWAIIDFAAKVCKASTPKCGICPISGNCKSFLEWNEGKQD